MTKNPFRKLSQQQIDFIKLLMRSPDLGDGWRKVSDILATMVEKQIKMNPELFEYTASQQIRLSIRGRVIADYI